MTSGERRTGFRALGTDNVLVAFGGNAEAALERARGRALSIHREMSAFSGTSDVARVGAAAGVGPVAVSADTMAVLEEAERVSALSGGAFDATMGPATALWHFTGGDVRIPDEDATEAARGLVSWEDVSLDADARTAGLARPGQSLDLGGIAKGYAADEARDALVRGGVGDALVDLGGNVVAIGRRPDGEPWGIGIQDPTAPRGRTVATLSCSGVSVVTSGVNERFAVCGGVRYHHILDPRTCRPAASGLLSVTIVSERAIEADGLATAAFVLGLGDGLDLVRAAGADAVFVTAAGDVLSTFDVGAPYLRDPAPRRRRAAECPGRCPERG